MQKYRFLNAIPILAFILLVGGAGKADVLPVEGAAKLLPDRIGIFKAISQVRPPEDRADDYNGASAGSRDYQLSTGQKLTVSLYKSSSDSGAYARFSEIGPPSSSPGKPECKAARIGTMGCSTPDAIFFFKGSTYVAIHADGPSNEYILTAFATHLADTLDRGEGEIPPLVKHLPGWQNGDLASLYSVTLRSLKNKLPNQPIFDAFTFDGGAEAALANYGASKLVIIEFNTPQLATDNSARILARIQELRSQGQPTPTAYRRVGNYSVFVFDAPTPEAANQLIDQVKYQQVVQWLGENPFAYERATREFTETTLGVFVSVVKASGLALVTCLAVGGLFGTVLFRVRRAQQRDREAYADSDAMLRLNLDELTPESDARRLLQRRN